MKNKNIILISILLIALITACSSEPTAPIEAKVKFITSENEILLDVAVADTKQERSKGLMYVEKLVGIDGMLFVFGGNVKTKFWMKNTLMALDMIFIDENMQVIHITHNAIPCEKDPCKNYGPDSPYLYVVETEAGFTKKKGVGLGDKVEIIENP